MSVLKGSFWQLPVKENGEILSHGFVAFAGDSDLSKGVSTVAHTRFSPGFPASTDGVHNREGAGMVPASAACVAILRFLQALFVTIFESRFDTYSGNPLDYWACKLSFGKYCVLIMMGRNFMEKERSLSSPLYSSHVGGKSDLSLVVEWDLERLQSFQEPWSDPSTYDLV